LFPGEQALINRAGNGGISKQQVNLDKEVAWKNGVFSFADEDIR
jgi:transmembrane sensor